MWQQVIPVKTQGPPPPSPWFVLTRAPQAAVGGAGQAERPKMQVPPLPEQGWADGRELWLKDQVAWDESPRAEKDARQLVFDGLLLGLLVAAALIPSLGVCGLLWLAAEGVQWLGGHLARQATNVGLPLVKVLAQGCHRTVSKLEGWAAQSGGASLGLRLVELLYWCVLGGRVGATAVRVCCGYDSTLGLVDVLGLVGLESIVVWCQSRQATARMAALKSAPKEKANFHQACSIK
jgi:hypothetical protein